MAYNTFKTLNFTNCLICVTIINGGHFLTFFIIDYMDIPLFVNQSQLHKSASYEIRYENKCVCNIVDYLDCSWGMKQQNIEKRINKILPQTNIIQLGMHSFINAQLILHFNIPKCYSHSGNPFLFLHHLL